MMRRPPRSALFPYTTLSRSLRARRRRDRPPAWRAVAFASGVAVLLLSLVSPLDTLAHEYLFSAHMAQHLLLTLVVPPLLLLGLPDAERGARSAERGTRTNRASPARSEE